MVYRSGGGDAAYRTSSLQTAAIEAALGVLLVFLVARGARQGLQCLAASVPFAAAGFGAPVLAAERRNQTTRPLIVWACVASSLPL